MGLRFCRPNKVTRGGPNVPLGPPDPCAIKPIVGDGNCFFRSVSYIITGSELQHMDVRRVVLRYTPENLDRTWQDNLTKMAIYLRHPHNHCDVVLSTLQSWDPADVAPPLLPSTTFSLTHTHIREQHTKDFVFTCHVQACIATYNMHTHTHTMHRHA